MCQQSIVLWKKQHQPDATLGHFSHTLYIPIIICCNYLISSMTSVTEIIGTVQHLFSGFLHNTSHYLHTYFLAKLLLTPLSSTQFVYTLQKQHPFRVLPMKALNGNEKETCRDHIHPTLGPEGNARHLLLCTTRVRTVTKKSFWSVAEVSMLLYLKPKWFHRAENHPLLHGDLICKTSVNRNSVFILRLFHRSRNGQTSRKLLD